MRTMKPRNEPENVRSEATAVCTSSPSNTTCRSRGNPVSLALLIW